MIPTVQKNKRIPGIVLHSVALSLAGLILMSVEFAAAQQTGDSSQSVAKPALADELLKSLQQLKSLRHPESSSEPSAPATSIPQIDEPTQSADDERIQALQKRIELLRSIMDRGSAPPTQSEDSAATQGHGHDAAQHAAGSATGNGANPEHPQASQSQEFPMPSLEEGPENGSDHEGSQSESHGSNSQSPKFIGEAVIPNPVDPLELANSLFQTGNYDLALKTYQAAAKNVERPQDLLWAEYFIASCQRIKGDLSAAESGYRNLVESKRPSRAVEAARFWLERIEHRRNAEQTIKEIEKSLGDISRELEKHGH